MIAILHCGRAPHVLRMCNSVSKHVATYTWQATKWQRLLRLVRLKVRQTRVILEEVVW